MKTLGTVGALILLVAFSACQKKEESAAEPALSASPPEAPKTETDKAGAPPTETAAPATDDKAAEGDKGGDKTVAGPGGTKVEKDKVSAGDTTVDKNGVKVGGTGVTTKKTGSGAETNVGGGVKVTTGADGKKKVNVGGLQIAK